MTDPLDRYLEGGVERAALTPKERTEADLVKRVIDDTRAFLDARPAPDLTAGVVRQVEQIRRPEKSRRHSNALNRLVESLWTARQVSFRLRPAYVVPAIAAIVLLTVFPPYGQQRSSVDPPPVGSAGTAPKLFVQFRLEATAASSVRLAGSFTNWQPVYELHETAPGIWTITLPLTLGVHDYAFVVDGQQWVPDPYAPHVDDGFGGTNSRIALLPPDVPQS